MSLAAYGIGGLLNVMAGPISGKGAPSANFIGKLGQSYYDTTLSPPVEYVFNGIAWTTAGANPATNSTPGTVLLATLAQLQGGNAPAGPYVPLSNDVATVIQGIVVGAVPPATETQQGIAEIATQVETDAGVDDARIVTPLKLANFVASGGFPAVFTDLTATGAVTFTGVTGALSMTSTSASSLGVTGAGIDLTLASSAGRVVVNGEEAAADAVRILSAAGGLDVNTALQINIDSSQAAADAIRIVSSNAAGGLDLDAGTGGATIDSLGVLSLDAVGLLNVTSTRNNNQAILISTTQGGIDISATGVAGNDIDISGIGTSVNISSTENAAEAIYLRANGGLLETIRLHADQGTGVASVNIGSDVGGITISGGLGTADAINLTASTAGGGIDIDASTGGVDVLTTGGISLDASLASNLTVTGAAVDLTLSSVGGSVVITGTEAAADAIQLNATTALGGIDVNAGTGGMTIDSLGLLSLDAAGVVNLTTTGAFDITVNSTAGSVVITGAEAAVDAIQLNATTAGGGIDINAGTGGITIDSTGAFSIDGVTASNVTTTGAGIDLTLSSVGGSVLVESTENAALAIRLHANGGTSETIQIHADQGTGVASIGLLSDVGGITVRSTGLASADAINLEAAAGGIDMDSALQTVITSSQAAATAIQLTASDAAGGINFTSGTGNVSVTGGHLKIATTGKGLQVKGGAATDMVGTATLILGTITVANTNIATGDLIFLSRVATNGSVTLGMLTYTITNATSFTITSVILGTPASTQTADVSSVAYFIVRPV